MCSMPASIYHNPGSHAYQSRQLIDLLVGHGDAALGPVEILVNARVAPPQTVDPEVAAERGVLGRKPAGADGAANGLERRLVDLSPPACGPALRRDNR